MPPNGAAHPVLTPLPASARLRPDGAPETVEALYGRLPYDRRCWVGPFEPALLYRLRGRAHDAAMMGIPGILETIAAAAHPRYTVAGHVEDRLAVVAGVLPMHQGVADAWMLTAPAVEEAKAAFCRATAEIIDVFARDLGLHRLQAHVAADHPRAIRFAHHLGFVHEADLIQFGPDRSDWVLMRYQKET